MMKEPTPICWCIAVLLNSMAGAPEELDQKRTATEAVALWGGLVILAVIIIGIGLMWGVSRGARWIMKKHEPVHTDMKDIWYLNPPEKRKQDEP